MEDNREDLKQKLVKIIDELDTKSIDILLELAWALKED